MHHPRLTLIDETAIRNRAATVTLPVKNPEDLVNAVSPGDLSTIQFMDESSHSLTDSAANGVNTK